MKKAALSFIAICLITLNVNSQCPGPTSLTLLDLNPTEVQVTPNQNASIFERGPSGYTPGTGATAGVGGTLLNCNCNTPILENLSPNAVYDIYARFYCGTMGYSPNSSKLTVVTPPCPETFTYGSLGSVTSWHFGGYGYYDYYDINGSPDWGAEKIVKFTPSSDGYYDLKLSRPVNNPFTSGGFLLRQAGSTCNFVLGNNPNEYSGPQFYTDTVVSGSVWNYYYRIGPLSSGITYDLFFDSNDTTYDFNNYQEVSLSFIGCSSAPFYAYSNVNNICNGSSVTLSQNGGILAAGGSYKWYSGSCGGTLVGTGGSITVSPSTTTTYYVRGEAPCGNSICASITIAVINAAITPSGNVTNCGGQLQLSTPYMNWYSYQWKKNGVNIPNTNFATYSPRSSGSYTVEISSLSCTATSPQAANVTVTLPTSITASGPTVLCPGGSVVLTANQGMTGQSFNWYNNGNYIGSNQSITATTTGTYSVTAYTSATCFNNTSIPVVAGMTTAPISPAGTAATCAGSSVTLSVQSAAGLTYHWKLNGTNISGATNASYNASTAGNYTVNISNGSCQGLTATAKAVTVNPLPVVTVTASYPTTFCDGGNSWLNSTPTGNYYRQWKNNGINIPYANSSYYAPYIAGSFTVIVQDYNGCIATSSPPVVTTVNPLPSAIITPGGPTSFCGADHVVLNAPSGTNRTYQWKKEWVNIPGETNISYTATASGTYRVTVTNTATGCSKTTINGAVVTKKTLPAATITPQGPTSFCAGNSVVLQANTGTGLTYKWKKNNNYIAGATLSAYTATQAGTYKTEVTKANGCSKTSAGTVVTVPCKEDESGEENGSSFDVKVSPNPSSGAFIFDIQNPANIKTSITVYDAEGRLILTDVTFHHQFTVLNSHLVPGIYSAVITIGDFRKIIKLVKTE